MMKISFEIIRHHCLVLATKRNAHTCVCFYVNIRFNKIEFLYNKTFADRFGILEEIKIYKVIGKKYLTKWLLKLKRLNSQKLLFKLLVVLLEPSQTSKMETFVKIVNSIKLLTIFTKDSILDL